MKPASYVPRRVTLSPSVVLLVICLMSLACGAAMGPLDSWQIRRQVGGSVRVVYGNDRFVVAASSPLHLLVSTNGTDWKAYLPPETGGFASLEFANGNFLLLLYRYGASTNNGLALYSSVDGAAWVLRRFNPSGSFGGSPISSAGGGNGMYVMASSDLSVSTDLVTWRQAVLGSTGIREFACGRGLLMGASWWGSGFAATSDGIFWEYIPAPSGFAFNGVRFANGRFATFAPAGQDGVTPPAIAISPYGYDWTSVVMPDHTNYTRLTAANERFFLLSSVSNVFYSSADALSWESHSFGTNMTISDVAFGANTYVAVGDAILQSAPVTNASSVPAALFIRNVPGLTISGPVGQAYQIEFTESLSEANPFVPLTNVVATSNPFLWLDVGYTNSKPRFYRAMTLPAEP